MTSDPVYDLRALVRDHQWPDAQVTALRNTCLAAAGADTMSAADRELAAAIAAALDGRSPGIGREHMEFLARAGLTGMNLAVDTQGP